MFRWQSKRDALISTRLLGRFRHEEATEMQLVLPGIHFFQQQQ